ncbi:MAG: hypothetical protein RLY86_1214 [Pseudomonadota bacterium]|jgi:glutamate-1-semialdehyde 2,1-aminomutase
MTRLIAGIPEPVLTHLLDTYRARYLEVRPRCRRMAADEGSGFHDGVPMHWMRDWPMPEPLIVDVADGAIIQDIDGNELADFCLGDTGAMFGHSPPPVVAAIQTQAEHGLTAMLPGEDAMAVGRLLAKRFRLPRWQVATTATDANRFALRVARAVTGRSKILVFNGCYHGTVDETFVRLIDGKPAHRPGLLGQAVDLTATTKVVEFNDIPALAAALADRDVACVITEPVLTNCATVLPDPGFHDALWRLTRETGTLLLIDETHTISTGPGGYTRAHGLEPDIMVIGKPVAGGVPAAVWGFTDAVGMALTEARKALPPGHSGMGTTLSANLLTMAAMRATLEEVMTETAYAHMDRLATRLEAGLTSVITAAGLPWHVVRVGARLEIVCTPKRLRNGGEAEAMDTHLLEQVIHLGLLVRGFLVTPFHCMLLVCPATTAAQVDGLVAALAEVVDDLRVGE